jgi:hypothetical protein
MGVSLVFGSISPSYIGQGLPFPPIFSAEVKRFIGKSEGASSYICGPIQGQSGHGLMTQDSISGREIAKI